LWLQRIELSCWF